MRRGNGRPKGCSFCLRGKPLIDIALHHIFVLTSPRLRANGVISVENPVRTAVEQGRFEELPDDYQEDVD